MRSYNLFCLKSVTGLCCAVPDNCAVPAFVDGGRWTYSGKLEDGQAAPVEFDGRAAETGVRFNGYYLFQTVDPRFA
jgi:hypothetical protein